MNHNFETIKLKLRAYNIGRGTLPAVFDELADMEKELREMIAKTDHPVYLILASTFIKNYLLDEGKEIMEE